MDFQGPACCIDPLRSTAQETDLWVPLHEFELPKQTVRECNVIRVHDGNVSPACESCAGIARLRQAAMRNLSENYSGVPSRVAPNNCLRFVGRAEVGDDELKVFERLSENAFNRLRKKALDITSHHND